jgi:hypothetical protein
MPAREQPHDGPPRRIISFGYARRRRSEYRRIGHRVTSPWRTRL